ncbi:MULTISPECIES: CDP-alcohol phosphatidyltransferase family protein [Wolbachia]|uniref:CDP-alcohol phosphatidyltransferase family protein n=1 Tax=Wolbachia TaxID=953 RepID=UPI00024034EC|nr:MULTISPECIES: CDP-alcohol phosphatidyltransferase family protein [Wolbachia]UYC23587.1 CDP-alcohol phosphatidyltransferase family protein [Wolbachia endosymbiont of Aedes aegypti]QBB84163.1 CDP-diacylglycerol--serine O-phosphatidyltransferase [Wolbachia pipientis wAlbB]QDW08961.1 CDP-diacylglycerol--serine O-phosphatidyltransferase [Wolbachia pipientis]QDW10158.1 CDP-diacylglycerol--serine O-phosphatidyltransferase [Wolbachia pipientis]QZA83231.1 CDP-alcohol phosphatidyltransferase family p
MNNDESNSKFLPITKLFPNFITLLGLCAGLTSLKFTFNEQWEFSAIFIIIAAIIDGMDGRIARILKSTSDFGAQLDSFADFLNFGSAPAFLLYFWKLNEIKVVGWILVMIYVICISIRLARFNVSLHSEQLYWKKFFFSGIPAPVCALLVLFPIIITFQSHESEYLLLIEQFFNIKNTACYFLAISFFSISHIPTFSAKYIYVPKSLSYIFVSFFGILIIFFISKPWITLPILGAVYILTIPISTGLYIHYAYKTSQLYKK